MKKTLLRTLAGILGVWVVFLGGLYVYGMMLPETHTTTVTETWPADRLKAWNIITDYENTPTWWSDVKRVETGVLSSGTVVTWNYDDQDQKIGFITTESVAGTKLVRKIIGDDLAFGGTWTFEIDDTPTGGMTISITEDGFVKAPFFRAVMALFIGSDKTMKGYLAALKMKLGVPET